LSGRLISGRITSRPRNDQARSPIATHSRQFVAQVMSHAVGAEGPLAVPPRPEEIAASREQGERQQGGEQAREEYQGHFWIRWRVVTSCKQLPGHTVPPGLGL
jgi:hypothetical protein